jgi:D-sedoheptulose 7-phosphate isomerase
MGLKPTARQHVNELAARMPEIAATQPLIEAAIKAICECHLAGGKLLLCGNGGSASDSEHIAGELMKSFMLPRRLPESDVRKLSVEGGADGAELAKKLQRGVAAVALTAGAPLATAIANDTDAALVFAQQVYVLGRPGDLLIGLSTSGNSRNVLCALKTARAFGLKTLGLTGGGDGRMDALCDILLKCPSTHTHRIQEYHLAIYHVICLAVEEELFGE